jgi:ergothioneine biosynthesis protein EgtB
LPEPAAITPLPLTSALSQGFQRVRAQTLALAEPLSEADCQAQSMADASPVKWHLAHVTWFFETFVLEAFEPAFRAHHPAYRVLFNSYYNGVGEQHPRPQRGLITRPSLAEVKAWRSAVDARVLTLLAQPVPAELGRLVELGLQHEQQHQELLLTDVLHLLSCNPLAPAYRPAPAPLPAPAAAVTLQWLPSEGGPVDIGHAGSGFAFDNETPRHRHWLAPHALANRLVTQGEWAEFIADGGYRDPRWWLAAGWDWVRTQGVQAPLYWRPVGSQGWQAFTLHGLLPLQAQAPVVHISLYEADAYTRWRAAATGEPLRLPTEAEWEHAAQGAAQGLEQGNFVDSGALQPLPARSGLQGLQQHFGDVWEWTQSAYLAYPGFRASPGAVGEYNGKFMVNQTVLRGGSCASPRQHLRASYHNVFPADARWQFTGLRLARDLQPAPPG